MKLIWLTDLHFSLEPLFGIDPAEQVDAAVAYVCEFHGDAACCVISGDLANHGNRDAYEALRGRLQSLAMPILPLIGNHDDRGAMRDVLSPPVDEGEPFVHYAHATDAGTVICLDTQKAGEHSGELCAARLDWLDATLSRVAGQPAYIFMHHPPLAIGMLQHDETVLENPEAFLAVLRKHEHVRHIFAGHVHRGIAGNVGGFSFTAMSSLLFQSPGLGPAWDWDSFRPPQEPPALGVVLLRDDAVLVHYEQFLSYRTAEFVI